MTRISKPVDATPEFDREAGEWKTTRNWDDVGPLVYRAHPYYVFRYYRMIERELNGVKEAVINRSEFIVCQLRSDIPLLKKDAVLDWDCMSIVRNDTRLRSAIDRARGYQKDLYRMRQREIGDRRMGKLKAKPWNNPT